MTTTPMQPHRAIRVVALFEALKGVLVLLAATGLLAALHQDLHSLAALLIEHAHLNPASKYPKIFLDAAAHMHDSQLMLLAFGAATYAAVRLVEAYGLYRERAWAEILAAASGAIYMPVEAYEWCLQPTWLRAGLFVVNAGVVALMLRALLLRRRKSAVPGGR